MLKKTLPYSLALLLLGCGSEPSDINIEYQARLSNVLDVSFEEPAQLSPYQKPTVTLPETKETLSILELIHIDHCKLGQLIANKNTQLGKVATPSNQLIYNVSFLQLAPDCLADENTRDTQVKEIISRVIDEKSAHLPAYFANMLINEKETAQFLYLSASEIPEDNSGGESQALEAINTLKHIALHLDNPSHIEPNALMQALEKLNRSHYVQSLLTSVRRQTQFNDLTTQTLSTLNIQTQICPQGKNKQKANTLNTVFSKFFLTQLQAYQARLDKQLTNLNQALSPVEKVLRDQSLAYPDSKHLLNELKRSAKEHVIWWQKFYKQCNIRP